MQVPVEVAVAVLIRSDGAVLLGQRPNTKVYPGFWEFPGGKIEAGEPAADALNREIQEELGVEVELAYPWITRTYTYPHARVRLHFHRVYRWRGEPRALEHAALAWRSPGAIDLEPLLPANGPVLRGLLLPMEYAITRAAEMGIERFLSRLDARLQGGLKLVQVREKSLSPRDAPDFARRVISLARPRGAKVLINADAALACELGADGVHLTAAQLRAGVKRPEFEWCGASCHSTEELRLAEAIGADFAVLGPVRPTPSHPDSQPLGWPGFAEIAHDTAIPVYALGGIDSGNLDQALSCAAHGIAMVRGAWS